MNENGMFHAIMQFPTQFQYQPVVENADALKMQEKIVVLGMGGSHLAADILQAWKPSLALTTHRDYGLPELSAAEAKKTLYIASSYSGNTEEVLDGFQQARERGYTLAAICVGGKLLELAKQAGVPYIQLPNTGIQPRSSLGYGVKALLALLGDTVGSEEATALTDQLDVEEAKAEGKRLAEVLADTVPIIYSSTRNLSIAYNWKIKLNETGKIPAFYNVVPELNHNEMTGFDARGGTKALAERFHWIVLFDATDHPSNAARMNIVQQLLQERGLPVEALTLEGRSPFEKIFRSLLVADWCAYYTAERYGVESEQVPMVEEFKKLVETKTQG